MRFAKAQRWEQVTDHDIETCLPRLGRAPTARVIRSRRTGRRRALPPTRHRTLCRQRGLAREVRRTTSVSAAREGARAKASARTRSKRPCCGAHFSQRDSMFGAVLEPPFATATTLARCGAGPRQVRLCSSWIVDGESTGRSLLDLSCTLVSNQAPTLTAEYLSGLARPHKGARSPLRRRHRSALCDLAGPSTKACRSGFWPSLARYSFDCARSSLVDFSSTRRRSSRTTP